MNLQDRSEQINELNAAMAKAQGEIGPALKESVNPHFKQRYADFNSVWNACRGALSKNGLAVYQRVMPKEGAFLLETMLAHTSGQWISSFFPIVPQKNDSQGFGSALTYMKRYALASLVGVSADVDDDAESAVGRGPNRVVKNESPRISPKELEELTSVLIDCGAKYKDNVLKYLKKEYEISSLDWLSPELYQRVMKSALEKRQEMQETQKEFARKADQGEAVNG